LSWKTAKEKAHSESPSMIMLVMRAEYQNTTEVGRTLW